MAGKYERLGRHLGALQSPLWPATFRDVEAVLGSVLPPSARKYPVWWSNDESHSQASAWMNAGWRTSDVNVRQGTVVFRRRGAPLASAAGDRRHRFRPAAARPDRSARRPVEEPPTGVDATAPGLAGWGFRRFDSIEPEAWAGGRPKEFMPQKRYRKAGRKPLNPNGHGPFCRFREPELPTAPVCTRSSSTGGSWPMWVWPKKICADGGKATLAYSRQTATAADNRRIARSTTRSCWRRAKTGQSTCGSGKPTNPSAWNLR